jgi:hypothetical protein
LDTAGTARFAERVAAVHRFEERGLLAMRLARTREHFDFDAVAPARMLHLVDRAACSASTVNVCLVGPPRERADCGAPMSAPSIRRYGTFRMIVGP